MNTQPEALRLADALECGTYLLSVERDITAAELRRLHEVEKKYHESVGGFKRDLAEKLEQQRNKNKRLHEVNQELLEACRVAKWSLAVAVEKDYFFQRDYESVKAAISKAEGESNE